MKSIVAKQVVSRHRLFCMSCGTKLAQGASKRVGLCQACRRHCVCCGQPAEVYGHHDVCIQCGLQIGQKIECMKRGKGSLAMEQASDSFPRRRARCAACGDPSESVIAGRPYCAECRAEKEGPPPCTNCGDPGCDGNCERDESDQT